MSLLKPVPSAELGTKYTHYGWFLGLVPVYLADVDSDAPVVVERNWVPEWYSWAAEALFGLFCWAASLVIPNFEPMFSMLVTGEFKK